MAKSCNKAGAVMGGLAVKKQNNRTKMIMHACERCGGAAYLEDPHEDDWRCLQCARTVPSPLVAERRAVTLSAA
jgi:PHP family Zn ribbon phosphoesterase